MKTTRFTLELDGDTQGEPPRIYIYDHTAKGQVAEFFLEPVPLVKDPDTYEAGHWDFPLLAKQTVHLMNTYA